MNVECYTVPEAARALGKGELTVKRWIEEELIPEPVLTDTSRGYRQYSIGELRVLATILALHEQEYSYYAKSHVETRERIERDLAAYRNRYV